MNDPVAAFERGMANARNEDTVAEELFAASGRAEINEDRQIYRARRDEAEIRRKRQRQQQRRAKRSRWKPSSARLADDNVPMNYRGLII